MKHPTMNEIQANELLALVDKRLAAQAQADIEKGHVTILHKGKAITLPADPTPMSIPTSIKVLQRKHDEDSGMVGVSETVDAFPWDGAVAFHRALKAVYGWVGGKTKKSVWGDNPPTHISIEIGYGETAQVPWGAVEIPGIKGYLETGVGEVEGRKVFAINGEVAKRHLSEVQRIAELTRELVKTDSIYKGKAIRFRVDGNKLNMNEPPRFLDLSSVKTAELVFTAELTEHLGTNLFSLIEHTDICRKLGIPLKRGVLLEGAYGTGKTQTAFVTADRAVKNGWSFIMLESVSALADALAFARSYQPCVVFAEDIDRVVSGEHRSTDIDSVLNTIDGIESKGAEVLTVLTTNHVETINPAMLRPGRLDAVISVTPPDAPTAEKLIRVYAKGLIAEETDISTAGIELDGQIPAMIREVVERSKLYAINREGTEHFTLLASDLIAASRQMKAHMDLLNTKESEQPPDVTALISDSVVKALKGNGMGAMEDQVDEIHSHIL